MTDRPSVRPFFFNWHMDCLSPHLRMGSFQQAGTLLYLLPLRLQSTESQRVGHSWANWVSMHFSLISETVPGADQPLRNVSFYFFLFFNFYCVLGYSQLIGVVMVSGRRWGNLSRTRACIHPRTPLPFSPPHRTLSRVLAGPCCYSILNIAVCTRPS